jgi:hypothetical protein
MPVKPMMKAGQSRPDVRVETIGEVEIAKSPHPNSSWRVKLANQNIVAAAPLDLLIDHHLIATIRRRRDHDRISCKRKPRRKTRA